MRASCSSANSRATVKTSKVNPLVGPAGAMLQSAIEEAGIDPAGVYVTNAVKHFRFVVRGKRRIHQKPRAIEIRRLPPLAR